ncbi:MAG: hypothetical protein RLZZ194_897 [Actinomycetota bacterium]
MQFNKKNVVAAFTLLFLAACSSSGGNSITGREVPESPIVVVKIDDTNEAHPQVGIDKADLIYIEQVEGGLVRLAALFSSKLPDYIGPVRSARISDIDLLAQFGKVAFFYSGAQSKLYPVIKEANLFDIGAMHESPKIYTRDPDRIAPYDMVLYGPEVKKRIADLDVATTKDFGFTFGDLVKKGRKISSVKLNWPAASYSANWNGKSWDLLHNGKADVTSDGIQISPSTFIIQTVVITDSEYQDKLGGVTPLSITVGEGTGWVLRDGFAIKAKWNRPDASSGTTWSDLDGNEIKMAAGQVWVALTDQAPEFTAPPSKK